MVLNCEQCAKYFDGCKGAETMKDLENFSEYICNGETVTIRQEYKGKVSETIIDVSENLTGSQRKIADILDSMKDLLLYKNKKYGDSALNPNNIFYKGDSHNSILIRLDDKLGRVKNNKELKINDVADIIGYCSLLLVSMGATKEDLEKLKD